MYSERINSLPAYLFAEIEEIKDREIKKGRDIIDLSIGDPDQPTPPHIIESLCEAAKDPKNHRYPSYRGMLQFREAVAEWYRKKGVDLDPEEEVITLIGSKEGIAHVPIAFLNPGDVALVPDPAYPVYRNATILSDGIPRVMPLLEERGFKPDLERIKPENARVMFLNYPNNPTTAVADEKFFREAIDFAHEHDIILCHDNPYSEITYDGYEAPSFLSVKGAKEVGIEFHSLSKTYNMTGWRIGFACGNAEIIKGLGNVKSNVDSGVFQAVQIAGISALKGPQDCVRKMREIYRERRDTLCKGLREAGFSFEPPLATFYVWVRVPKGYDSMSFTEALLSRCGIIVTPGIGFGEHGEGYVRFALTESVERIEEAVERLKNAGLW
ncbi:MAG: LL-diaminopimelate aminotransferase [Candidatus Syntropharchaeia archaeon]